MLDELRILIEKQMAEGREETLEETAESQTVEQLETVFMDNFVAYYRSHVAHVNVIGRNFTSDHKLLQKVYEDLQDQIDRIAELLRTLGDWMPCSISEMIADSNLDIGPIEGTSDELLEAVLADIQTLAEEYRTLITIADKEGQQQISNYAQDRVLALDKFVWMFKATLEV
jgi:starvation-inducible DNA-binding protein